MHLLRPLSALVLATAPAVLAAPSAHAGPTASVDLDFGTATNSAPGPTGIYASPSPLYTAGFVLRVGWRFDVAPVWFVPEIGGGYVVERFEPIPTTTSAVSGHVGLLFGGGRFGFSVVVQPELRFEPGVFGHVGGGWYSSSLNAPAFDVGLALDLRIRRRFIVGAHVGYDVVILSHVPNEFLTPPVTDPWVSYGLHGGFLFW